MHAPSGCVFASVGNLIEVYVVGDHDNVYGVARRVCVIVGVFVYSLSGVGNFSAVGVDGCGDDDVGDVDVDETVLVRIGSSFITASDCFCHCVQSWLWLDCHSDSACGDRCCDE